MFPLDPGPPVDGLRSLATAGRRPRHDAVATMWSSLRALARDDRSSSSAPSRAAAVRDLALLVDRTRAELARAVAELDADDGWAADGAVSPVAWLTHGSPIPRSESSSLLRLGRFLRRFPTTAEAVATGRLSCAAAEVVARVATGDRRDRYELDEAVLLEQVQRLARVDDVAVVMQRWATLADDQAAAADADAAHRGRFVSVSRTLDDAGVVEARLDAAGVSLVVQALALLDPGPDPDDVDGGPRSPGQRRADALVEMARRTVASQSAGRRGSSATVHVVVDAEHLDLVAHAQPDGCNRPIDVSLPTCEVDGVPAPIETVRRLLCDSLVSRAVLRGKRAPLELGHATRTFTSAQRRAIVLRDGGCVAHGCDRGPEFCEVHHLVAWEAGGTTDVANGALLCARHHQLVHEGGWEVVRRGDGRPMLRPRTGPLPGARRRFRHPAAPPDDAALDQRIRRRLLDLRAEIHASA